MGNGHDSPYLWVNWFMWLANTNGRKPAVFSLERSQQIIMCSSNSGMAGRMVRKPLDIVHLKVIPKTTAYRSVSKQSAGKSVLPHFDFLTAFTLF